MKFHDLNADGVKDPLEPGLPNWEIKIYDASNVLVDTKLTDAAGKYEFKGLAAGNYTVCETPQAGWTQSFPVAGPGIVVCANTTLGYAITLTQGQLDEGNDFGNWQPATKSGRKFNDLAGDHIDDITDPGLQNWTISIYDGSNVLVSFQLTDANGHYEFTGLTPGSYTVCETPQPPTWTQTFPQLGIDPNTVTCTNRTIGYAITLDLRPESKPTTTSATGSRPPPPRAGMKLNDVNGNGVKDAGRRRASRTGRSTCYGHRRTSSWSQHDHRRRYGNYRSRSRRPATTRSARASARPATPPDLSPTRAHPPPAGRRSSTPARCPTSGATSSPSPAAPTSPATTSATHTVNRNARSRR